jgi:hypothetical protein
MFRVISWIILEPNTGATMKCRGLIAIDSLNISA